MGAEDSHTTRSLGRTWGSGEPTHELGPRGTTSTPRPTPQEGLSIRAPADGRSLWGEGAQGEPSCCPNGHSPAGSSGGTGPPQVLGPISPWVASAMKPRRGPLPGPGRTTHRHHATALASPAQPHWPRPEPRPAPPRAPPRPSGAPLTGSLVFDEEQLEALLESVLVDVELHLDPGEQDRRGASTSGLDGETCPEPPHDPPLLPRRAQDRGAPAARQCLRLAREGPRVPRAHTSRQTCSLDLPKPLGTPGCHQLSPPQHPGPSEVNTHGPPTSMVTASRQD